MTIFKHSSCFQDYFVCICFQDYFAIELLDGHLHVHLDLGSGAIKIRASRIQLNDGNWHRVELTLRKNQGRVTIDGDTEAFETPGKSLSFFVSFFFVNFIYILSF